MGNEIRVLAIGPLLRARNVRRGVTLASTLSSSPTLHEFGVVLLRYKNEDLLVTPKEKWVEWREFLEAGGLAIIVGFDSTIQRYSEKLTGHDLPRMMPLQGETAEWVRGARFSEIMAKEPTVYWTTTVPRLEIGPHPVIGRNAAKDVIAFEVRVDHGNVVFLPKSSPDRRDLLTLALMDFARRQVSLGLEARRSPGWLTSVTLASETRLQAEKEILSNRLRSLSLAKRILFEDGKALSKECARILAEMLGPASFTVSYKEEEGGHDIEIVGGTVTILVEVKGSGKSVDQGAVSQLMAHAKTFSSATSVVKGCVIGNPHRVAPPSSRGPPFTPHCRSLAEANGYCILTTGQLLELYDRFQLGTIGASGIVALLTSTVGPLVI